MKIRIISFTDKGHALAEKVKDSLPSHEAELIFRGKDAAGPSLADICRDSFGRSIPLVFISAAGIAVRTVAPFVRDKLQDPPVIVIDELGRFVIPVLSGHVGGANELACEIAQAIDAVPVITTATDINDAFSVDLFAKENGLNIVNRTGIAKVSSSSLEGKPVTISIKDYPPQEDTDVVITDETDRILEDGRVIRDAASIVLSPKKYAIGMGCRRGKPFEDLREFATMVLEGFCISLSDVGCIATIDIKKDEEGLKLLSQAWRMPLITYEASVLARVPGEFSSSGRVLEQVGVDNVCERAAVLAAGPGSELVVRKTAVSGMTIAVAKVKQE